jgi:SET domain-containing protein
MRTSSYPRLVRRRSTLHGWGVFALDPITKNTRIVQYAGEKIPAGKSKAREAVQLRRGHIWCFSVNHRWVRDAEVGGNIAKYINHACKPNCYSQVIGDTIWIRAARNIRKGEELSYNYYTRGSAGITCNCVPGCENQL